MITKLDIINYLIFLQYFLQEDFSIIKKEFRFIFKPAWYVRCAVQISLYIIFTPILFPLHFFIDKYLLSLSKK